MSKNNDNESFFDTITSASFIALLLVFAFFAWCFNG